MLVQHNLMKNAFALFAAALCLFFSSCHRPVAYLLPTPYPAIDRTPASPTTAHAEVTAMDTLLVENQPVTVASAVAGPPTANRLSQPVEPTNSRVERRIHRMQVLLSEPTRPTNLQPEPKPKAKPKNQLRLGNKIRQGLGVPLRKELNWWQRISWKLKAAVFVILIAVVFAILHVPTLPIIFGILGAFLLISGLKKSFKVRRPWF